MDYTTPEWAETRDRIITRDGGCMDCGAGSYLQVHHLSYDKTLVVKAEDDELITLCRDCHYDRHYREHLRRGNLRKAEELIP